MIEKFTISRRDAETASVVYPEGYLDAHTAPVFEEELERAIAEGRIRIVVNCEKLTYISSAGLGAIMGLIEDVRERDGDIKMSNMTPAVREIVELLGFDRVYDIVETEADALARFA